MNRNTRSTAPFLIFALTAAWGLWTGSGFIRGGDDNPVPGVDWIAGDCDRDGRVTIGDAIHLLGHLFLGRVPRVCEPLCDSNGDSILDASDPVFLLSYLFLSQTAQPALFSPREVCDQRDNDCDGVVDEACVPALEGTVTLAWRGTEVDENGGPERLFGYRIYLGTAPGAYEGYRDVGLVTTHAVRGLEVGGVYHFAVAALDCDGNESQLSNVVSSVVVPLPE